MPRLKVRRPTSVDAELERIHRFRYNMDPGYALKYDNTQKLWEVWQENKRKEMLRSIEAFKAGR